MEISYTAIGTDGIRYTGKYISNEPNPDYNTLVRDCMSMCEMNGEKFLGAKKVL